MAGDKNSGRRHNRLLKYSGLVFQILAVLAIGYFLGAFIDKKLDNTQPYGVLASTVLFLIIGLYSIIKDILKES